MHRLFGGDGFGYAGFLRNARPYTRIYLDVTDASGAVAKWECEGSAPGGLLSGQVPQLFVLESDNFSTGNLSLDAGTYYLTLQDATNSSPEDDDAAWAINNGPSSAYAFPVARPHWVNKGF